MSQIPCYLLRWCHPLTSSGANKRMTFKVSVREYKRSVSRWKTEVGVFHSTVCRWGITARETHCREGKTNGNDSLN
jgi:hypothetical protein